jgi:hypothetical protein
LILALCEIELRSPLCEQLQQETHSPDVSRRSSGSISVERRAQNGAASRRTWLNSCVGLSPIPASSWSPSRSRPEGGGSIANPNNDCIDEVDVLDEDATAVQLKLTRAAAVNLTTVTENTDRAVAQGRQGGGRCARRGQPPLLPLRFFPVGRPRPRCSSTVAREEDAEAVLLCHRGRRGHARRGRRREKEEATPGGACRADGVDVLGRRRRTEWGGK